MAATETWPQSKAPQANASALVLLQAAAARAEIGPFARRGLESPRAATGCYRAAARLASPAGNEPMWIGRG